jgi:membrane protein DedA with SNARE-associated domain
MVGEDGLRRASAVADRYGQWGLAASRAVPVLAEASVILAGLVRAPFPRFLLITTAANLGIAAAYAAIGAFSMNVGSFLLTFAGALALPALAMLAARYFLGDRS